MQAYYQDNLSIVVDHIEENAYSFEAMSFWLESIDTECLGVGTTYAVTDTYYAVSFKLDINKEPDEFYQSVHTVVSTGNNVTMIGGKT